MLAADGIYASIFGVKASVRKKKKLLSLSVTIEILVRASVPTFLLLLSWHCGKVFIIDLWPLRN